ncbi:MAG: 6-phosphogluconolactonase/Glucosamine-6-phosphat eisomerase/deaminase-like protein [Acidimicrobiaceae bacterium]|nr:6-phosphogluconolactonase/Glucosamine-6-phosphat eisomerase/deaminase-like protein [Acidimicrobiaceae bacterium]
MSERPDSPGRFELHVVDDVAKTYAAIADAALARHQSGVFHLATSGGSGGRACIEAIAAQIHDLSSVELYFVDERCVPPDSPDSNARSIAEGLGEKLATLAAFRPMSCALGALAYEDELLETGPSLQLMQLGMGPDGHTASLFPDSPGLDAPPERLVIENHDPSGRNPHDRLSLTYSGIALAELAVMTVNGAAKHAALAAIQAGEDLPAARVTAKRLVWLVDPPAAGDLPGSPLPRDLLEAP